VSAGRLEVSGVSVVLGRAAVLRDVDLVAEPGTWTGVVGPNGAGKSTLLRAVAGLVRHTGRVLLDGREVARMDARHRATRIGYAPQVPVLPEGVTVREYVHLGRTPYRSLVPIAGLSWRRGPASPGSRPAGARVAGSRVEDDRAVVERALRRLDLDGLATRSLRTLSGGERQRAVLARALAQEPQVLLLDEPTTALDLGHAQQLLELVDTLRAEEGLTVVSTLHDLTLAGEYAQHLVLLAAGRVVAAGAPGDVLTEESLAAHYGARAEVTAGPDGVRVVPVRRRSAARVR